MIGEGLHFISRPAIDAPSQAGCGGGGVPNGIRTTRSAALFPSKVVVRSNVFDDAPPVDCGEAFQRLPHGSRLTPRLFQKAAGCTQVLVSLNSRHFTQSIHALRRGRT
jgi:hypothetical protein